MRTFAGSYKKEAAKKASCLLQMPNIHPDKVTKSMLLKAEPISPDLLRRDSTLNSKITVTLT